MRCTLSSKCIKSEGESPDGTGDLQRIILVVLAAFDRVIARRINMVHEQEMADINVF